MQIIDIIKLQVLGMHILFTESENTYPKPSNGCFKMATHVRAYVQKLKKLNCKRNSVTAVLYKKNIFNLILFVVTL